MESLFPDRPARTAKPPAALELSGKYCTVVVHRGIDRHGPSGGPRGQGDAARFDLTDVAWTYSIPRAFLDQVTPGRLVRVPLGKGDKQTTGVVLAVGDAGIGDAGGPERRALDPSRVKPIGEPLPAAMSAPLLELAIWLAAYYVCPLGMVLQSMMPGSVKRAIGRKKTTMYALAPEDVRTSVAQSLKPRQRTSFEAAVANLATATAEGGATFGPQTCKAMASAMHVSEALVKKWGALGLLVTSVRDEFSASHLPMGERAEASATEAPPATTAGPLTPGQITLSPDQARVLDALAPSAGHFAVHLLRGVTGSGKTEVYLTAIERLFAKDPEAGAIVLVPEIALTPQTSARFIERFGAESVAVLHSGLSAGQRSGEWSRIADGQVRLVVGARSAVFAPLRKLAIIVVDEEHDGSYKQDQLPRYHARDVAIKRAQIESCPVLLGSATPSLESWYNATMPAVGSDGKPKLRSHLHEMHSRPTGVPMPEVVIVDIREERKLRDHNAARASDGRKPYDPQLHLIGPTLEGEIDRTLTRGGQVMLLLNRRGYANYIMCPDPKCGFVLQCDHCDATMVYHRAGVTGGYVRCHHCLTEQLLPRQCPICQKRLNTFGMGTQRVEEELERKFLHSHGIAVGRTLIRADSDTMSTGRDYFESLGAFARGEARILLGTQMIAKGLDFPNVQLVGIINADTSLDMPDFRASERTFQLVAQVAGRAGRRGHRGRVIVQTMNPQARPIALAATHDYVTFATEELALRTEVGLPPVSKMARIITRDRVEQKAMEHAAQIYEALDEMNQGRAEPVHLRGPMPCPITRIDDHFRIAVELIASTKGALQAVLAGARAKGLLVSDRHTAVDVDPIALL